MLKPAEGPATIAILGGDPVIGRALESLLASADYVSHDSFPSFQKEPQNRSEGRGLRSFCQPRVASGGMPSCT